MKHPFKYSMSFQVNLLLSTKFSFILMAQVCTCKLILCIKKHKNLAVILQYLCYGEVSFAVLVPGESEREG